MVKNRPATWETWVQSLGCEERLGKETATHSSIFAWRILWTEEPGGLWPMGSLTVEHERLSTHQQKVTGSSGLVMAILYFHSTGSMVPRYLVKHYLGCVCEGVSG